MTAVIMRFSSEEERIQHPQAKLIPSILWSVPNLFNSNIDDPTLALMQADEAHLMSCLESSIKSITNKEVAWLAIAFSHSSLGFEELCQIANTLQLPEQGLFVMFGLLGKTNFFESIVNHYSKAGTLKAMIAADEYRAFRAAALIGYLDVMNRMLALSTDVEQQAMIAARDYFAFGGAVNHGHLTVISRLLEAVTNNKKQEMIVTGGRLAINLGIENNNFDPMNRMLELSTDDEQKTIIAGDGYRVFNWACDANNVELVNKFLKFSSVFAYAEVHKGKYGEYVDPFVDTNIANLRTRKTESEQDRSPVVFDIPDADEAKLFSYMLLHLLGRILSEGLDYIDSASLDDIHFLSKIPAVRKALADLVNPDELQGFLNFFKKIEHLAIKSTFFSAASKGHLKDINSLLEPLSPPEIKKMIVADRYRAFCEAARNGHLDVMKRLLEALLEDDDRDEMLSFSFRSSVNDGHLEMMNHLFQLLPPNQQKAMFVEGVNYEQLFDVAACNGHLTVIDRLLELVPTELKQEMIAHDDYCAFREAASEGHLTVINALLEAVSPGRKQKMIAAENHYAFRWAAGKGHLAVINRLLAAVADNKKQEMISDLGHEGSMFYVIENGHLDIINRLLEVATYDTMQGLIVANSYQDQVLSFACETDNVELVNQLLGFSSVFAYAEMHEEEYGEYVDPFVNTSLVNLHNQKAQLGRESPLVVFDILDAEGAKLCFYILRHLIRKNDEDLLDHILFLLEIPAVKALAHIAVTYRMPNELLRLALSQGNQSVAQLLLNIPAVRALAEQNNFYRNEVRAGLDCATLANDRESSMTALSSGEKQRLQEAIERYQPMIKNIGVPHLMDALRHDLEVRYAKIPAEIVRDGDGTKQELPLSWQDFQKITLKSNERQRALEAYFQHKEHTAWRYLSKPNPWMHAQAAYVSGAEGSPDRWSTFEEYQPLIAMLYLAAIDETMPPIDGYTIESRLTHFIDELAHIGRAHNWDETRIKVDDRGEQILDDNEETIEEEYDNLQGDRPSCFSGVKRRLFQSVQGHPLLTVLTLEGIAEALRDFVREHFKSVITDANRETLKGIRDKVINGDETSEEDWNTLKTVDITDDQQAQFIGQLTQKYGAQFCEDPSFVKHIKKAFTFTQKNEAHLLNFGHFNIDQYLEARSPSAISSSSARFFKASTETQPSDNPEQGASGLPPSKH